MAQWSALAAHLRQQGRAVTLSWSELADVVGSLPESAGNHRAWWSGDRPHVRAWRGAGFTLSGVNLGKSVTFVRTSAGSVAEPPAGSVVEPERVPQGTLSEQRRVEALMLALLGQRRAIELMPRRLTSPSGAYIDVDGVTADGSVLVECWAHRGPAKVAQKYKLVNDAAKLHWASSWLSPSPAELLLCVGDEMAVKHLRGKSWQGEAIRELGVKIEVVQLEDDDVAALIRAQQRQFR